VSAIAEGENGYRDGGLIKRFSLFNEVNVRNPAVQPWGKSRPAIRSRMAWIAPGA